MWIKNGNRFGSLIFRKKKKINQMCNRVFMNPIKLSRASRAAVGTTSIPVATEHYG